MNEAFFPEMLDNGHGGVDVSVEPLLQRLLVVVRPARALGSPLEASFDASALFAEEEQDELEVGLVAHGLSPPGEVVFVPRETIDEEVVLFRLLHSSLEEGASDFDGDDGTICDVALDQFAEFRTGLGALLSEKIAG